MVLIEQYANNRGPG